MKSWNYTPSHSRVPIPLTESENSHIIIINCGRKNSRSAPIYVFFDSNPQKIWVKTKPFPLPAIPSHFWIGKILFLYRELNISQPQSYGFLSLLTCLGCRWSLWPGSVVLQSLSKQAHINSWVIESYRDPDISIRGRILFQQRDSRLIRTPNVYHAVNTLFSKNAFHPWLSKDGWMAPSHYSPILIQQSLGSVWGLVPQSGLRRTR